MTRFFRTLRLTWFLLFVGLGMLAAATAHAQARTCLPKDVMRDVLAERFGERRIASGWMQDESVIVEWYGNPDTQTWSLLTTSPEGISCIETAGRGHISWPQPPNT